MPTPTPRWCEGAPSRSHSARLDPEATCPGSYRRRWMRRSRTFAALLVGLGSSAARLPARLLPRRAVRVDRDLDAAVLLSTLVRLVRRHRLGLAEPARPDARAADALRRQGVCRRGGAALREALVVAVGP